MQHPTRRRGRPRDQAGAARREEEILAVATRFFAGHGYRQTDVQWIADALGVGKGTVYRHFGSKEQLFLAAVDRGMHRLTAAVAEATMARGDALEMMVAAVRAYLKFFDDHPEVLELIIQERAEFKDRKQPTYFTHRDANIGGWRCLIDTLIREGRIRRVPPDRILDVLSCTLYGALFTDHFLERPLSFEDRARQIFDVVFNGVLVERDA